MKKGILVVSFGTSHMDTLDKTIRVMEEQIAEAYPEWQVYRAFTSGMILNKLRRTENIHFMNVKEALQKMLDDHVTVVAVQPTHIINGYENEKMLEDIREFQDRFDRMTVGKPMLSGTEDYKKTIHAIIGDIPLEEDEYLILMGHGTEHFSNSAYPALEYILQAMGYSHIHMATVEGYPELKDVMAKLKKDRAEKVALLPFMFVAGDHAKNDMAGEEDSWKQLLERDGYKVRPILQGLGELPAVRQIFMDHLDESMQGGHP